MLDLVCCYSKMKREKSVVDTGDTSNAFNDLSEAPLSGVVGHDVGSSRSREPEINCRKHGCSLTIGHTQSTGLCTENSIPFTSRRSICVGAMSQVRSNLTVGKSWSGRFRARCPSDLPRRPLSQND